MTKPLWNPIYKYDEVYRDETAGQHWYATPTGRHPSVTTILQNTMPVGKQIGLKRWKEKIGPGNARNILEMAAGLGTQMHAHLENYIKGEEREPDEETPFDIQGHYLAQILIDRGIECNVSEFWGTECPLYYPGLYSGTADAVGVHWGSCSVIDFKTSKSRKTPSYCEDYFLQLAAYSMAHSQMHPDTPITKGVIMMMVWDTDEPEYQQFVIDGEDFAEYKYKWAQRVKQYYEE